MENDKSINRTLFFLSVVFFTLILGCGIFTWNNGSPETLVSNQNLSTISRMYNSLFGGLLTSMALLITLTANLYTPRLVKLFVKHPIIIAGLSFILFNNFTIISDELFPTSHPWHRFMMGATYFMGLTSIAGLIPYLYYVSNFIRPSFFIPLLEKQVMVKIKEIHNKKVTRKLNYTTFDLMEVLVNIASTAAHRKDKRLTILILNSINNIFKKLIELKGTEKYQWRKEFPHFNPGLSIAGRTYLKNQENWPEAFVLGKFVGIVNSIHSSQNEVVAEVCEDLLETLQICKKRDHADLISMHLMVFNSLLRGAIEDKDLERYKLISYYYRIFNQGLVKYPKILSRGAKSAIFYAELADYEKMEMGKVTVFYDLSELIFHLALLSEKIAKEILENYVVPFWKKAFLAEDHLSLHCHRAVVKFYWETKYKKWQTLSEIIQKEFLTDDEIHINTLSYLYEREDKLHWEFNDRLMRSNYLAKKAKQLSREEFYDLQKKKAA